MTDSSHAQPAPTPTTAPATAQAAQQATSNGRWIAGFWPRLGAFVVDSCVLALVGMLLGLLLGDWLATLGNWPIVLGFGVSLAYFGVLNSVLNTGQTLGKALFKLTVVDGNNQYLTLARSCCRYSILAVPGCLNGLLLDAASWPQWLNYPLSLLVIGSFTATGYLVICNRATRQSLHDVLVGSFVVNSSALPSKPAPIWRGHWVVVALLCIGAAALPWLAQSLVAPQTWQQLVQLQTEVQRQPHVRHVVTQVGWRESTGTARRSYVSVNCVLDAAETDNKQLARNIALQTIEQLPSDTAGDQIQVVLRHGYNLGFWSSWQSHSYEFSRRQLAQHAD